MAVISLVFLAMIWALIRKTVLTANLIYGSSDPDAPWNPAALSFWVIALSVHFFVMAVPEAVIGVGYYLMSENGTMY